MAEIAIVSARKARLQQAMEQGSVGAGVALALQATPTRFLSTVQIGITLIGILTGAFGGASLAGNVAEMLGEIAPLEPYAESLAVLLVVAVITYLSLVVGELVPKRIGLRNPERIAGLVAGPMRLLSQVATPVVWLLEVSTNVLLRMLRLDRSGEQNVSEMEVIAMIEQGITEGTFHPTEQEMVERVFRLDVQTVEELMTPRTEVVWLGIDDTQGEISQKIIEHVYSNYPVCRDSIDQVLGIASAKDLLSRMLRGAPLELSTLIQEPLYVPATLPAAHLLERFKASGQRCALVIDEHGGLEGLVTLRDVMSEVVGEIDIAEPDVVERSDGSWLLDGLVSVHTMTELLEGLEFPEDEAGTYLTLSGFVMARLGRVPNTADAFEWSGYRFEVVDLDRRRVDKVLVQRQAQATSPATEN
ncbi:MAG: HlyC/CorC family transporter [Anaerolineae bacterium]|nr:HlyC/CorC family transporter [Anaerolineae bacterium]